MGKIMKARNPTFTGQVYYINILPPDFNVAGLIIISCFFRAIVLAEDFPPSREAIIFYNKPEQAILSDSSFNQCRGNTIVRMQNTNVQFQRNCFYLCKSFDYEIPFQMIEPSGSVDFFNIVFVGETGDEICNYYLMLEGKIEFHDVNGTRIKAENLWYLKSKDDTVISRIHIANTSEAMTSLFTEGPSGRTAHLQIKYCQIFHVETPGCLILMSRWQTISISHLFFWRNIVPNIDQEVEADSGYTVDDSCSDSATPFDDKMITNRNFKTALTGSYAFSTNILNNDRCWTQPLLFPRFDPDVIPPVPPTQRIAKDLMELDQPEVVSLGIGSLFFIICPAAVIFMFYLRAKPEKMFEKANFEEIEDSLDTWSEISEDV